MRNMLIAVVMVAGMVVLFAGCAKDEALPPEEPLIMEEADLLDDTIPPSSDAFYVAVFQDEIAALPSELAPAETKKKKTDRELEIERREEKNRDFENAKEAISRAVPDLKLKAFHEAAGDVLHALPQPMQESEVQRCIQKTAKDYLNFLERWKLVKHEISKKQSGNTIEKAVKFTAYFVVDKPKLREALVKERAVAVIAKYKTYVELFWNVPEKEISPEVVNTLIERIEDHFSQQGYEVVQFERIKGKLLKLVQQEEEQRLDSLFSANELQRFKEDLALRNIDTRFVNGKQILAEYADVLIGITISALEVSPDRMLTMRLAANATLVERGEWLSLAAADAVTSVPYVAGSTNSLIEVSEMAARKLFDELEPKVTTKLAQRKDIEIVQTTEERDFEVVFSQHSPEEFDQIRKSLGRVDKWEYKTTDIQNRMVILGYRGRADQLADIIEVSLSVIGIGVTPPQISAEGNRIEFGKK